MTKQERRPDKLRAALVWIYPIGAVGMVKLARAPLYGDAPSFWSGVFLTVLIGLVGFSSWGFWTGSMK